MYSGFPGAEKVIQLVRPGIDSREFQFDQIVDQNRDQDYSFETIAHPVVTDVLNGYNGVIMAYGQTGSGKTFTMEGMIMYAPTKYQIQEYKIKQFCLLWFLYVILYISYFRKTWEPWNNAIDDEGFVSASSRIYFN